MLRKFSFASVLLIAPILTQAQHPVGISVPIRVAPAAPSVAVRPVVSAPRSGVAPVRTAPRTAAPTSPLRPASPRTTHPVAAPRSPVQIQAGPAFADEFAEDDGFDVPGLGFDYPHFAAVHPDANRRHHNGNGFLFPGGLFLGSGPLYYGEPAAPAAPAESAQEEAPAQEAPDAEPAVREAPVRARRGADSYAAPAQVTEYVFVRRDGTVFFAVAYSWLNNDLQYITKDGLRRTVPRNALDLDATQQFNDQRGVSFHFPA